MTEVAVGLDPVAGELASTRFEWESSHAAASAPESAAVRELHEGPGPALNQEPWPELPQQPGLAFHREPWPALNQEPWSALPRESVLYQGPWPMRRRTGASRWAFLHEPFLHFVLLGAALFGVSHYLEERSRFTRITITPDQVRGIAENYRLQYGALPSPERLDTLVENFVREEIFYHEALKLGLDQNDEIIRRRLVQKYEFLQQDLAAPAEPSDAQLLDYYNHHLDQYRRPNTVSFTHVYFSPDGRGESGAREAAEELAGSLNMHRVSRAAGEGDRFPGAYDFSARSQDELGRVFGREGLAQSVFDLEPNRWSEPIRSGFGWHTVYVSARQPGRLATFEEVRASVRRDYIEAERDRRNVEALAKLRQGFVIVRE